MNNLLFFILALPIAAILQGQTPPPSPPKPELSPDTVVGTTGGKKVTVGDVQKLIEYLPPQLRQGYNVDPKGFLSQWFMLERLAQIAETEKIPEKSPYKETLEVQRKTFLMQAMLQERSQKTQVSLEDQKKYYEGKQADYAQAKVKLIYIPFVASQPAAADPAKKSMTEPQALAKAESLVKAARGGKDFVALAKENSEDPISKEKDGDFGPIKRSDKLPDMIKNTIFQLKPGAVSDPVRQPNGYYIFRLIELVPQPFDEVKESIANELRSKTVREWVEQNAKETELKVERPDFSRSPQEVTRALQTALRSTPVFAGRPIDVQFRADLTVSRGKLYSKQLFGSPVHAASYLIRRRIVLDSLLLADPRELRRILIHELFHFLWRRLGNPLRREWETLIAAEIQRAARGELGWSAEWRKKLLKKSDCGNRTRVWRHYLCESFCDTAAWSFDGKPHEEYTLAARYCGLRRAWLKKVLDRSPLSL